MHLQKDLVKGLFLCAAIVCVIGCSTTQNTKRAGEMEQQVASLTQQINDKDAQIRTLQGQLAQAQKDNEESQAKYKANLESLRNDLSVCRARVQQLQEDAAQNLK